jgi:hypothetical protein
MGKFLIGAAFATLMGLSGQAIAGTNLLVNGSFETGDLTGWTEFGDFSFSGVSGEFVGLAPEEGNYQAYLGSVDTTGGIYQTFADTPGAEYTVTGHRHRGPRSSLAIIFGLSSNYPPAGRSIIWSTTQRTCLTCSAQAARQRCRSISSATGMNTDGAIGPNAASFRWASASKPLIRPVFKSTTG